MVDNKRKRGRKPKSPIPETLDHQSTKSISLIEDIDTTTTTTNNNRHHLRRHRKPSPENPDKSDKTLVIGNGNSNGTTNMNGSLLESGRVVPAMDAVVKVFCTHTEPNFSLPWQRKRQFSSSSSGFVISGRRVLTNAHSVEHYTQVKLKKRGSDTKYVATVLAIGTECDIALLSVEDDEFWLDVSPVIMHFIKDYEKNGSYTGFPILGVEWQKMENPDLRKSMGMKDSQKGVRIRRIDPTAPEHKVLKPSDIILSFDGVDIANDGTVPFRHGERIGFSYLVSHKYTGDTAQIKVLRESKILKYNIKFETHRKLIPAHNKGRPPSYYIIAGLVFTTVSVPYLRSEYGKDYGYDAPVKLLDKLLHELPKSPDEQIVVVSQVLVADINIGYEEIVNTQVLAFNGQPVKNLKNLASLVESCTDDYLKFELDYQQIMVLQTKTAKAATVDILSTHCIPSAMSDDLKT